MPILVVGTEKNFAALRPRLFEGRISNKVAGEVAREIREANPDVDLDKLRPGMILTVPDSPKVTVSGELSLGETATGGVAAAADLARAALDEASNAAANREADAQTERARALKSLDALRGEAPRRREPGLAKDLEAARKALVEEDARAEERASRREKAHAGWAAQIDALKSFVEGT